MTSGKLMSKLIVRNMSQTYRTIASRYRAHIQDGKARRPRTPAAIASRTITPETSASGPFHAMA